MRTTNYSATSNSDNAISPSPNQTNSMTRRPRFFYEPVMFTAVFTTILPCFRKLTSRLTPHKNGIRIIFLTEVTELAQLRWFGHVV